MNILKNFFYVADIIFTIAGIILLILGVIGCINNGFSYMGILAVIGSLFLTIHSLISIHNRRKED